MRHGRASRFAADFERGAPIDNPYFPHLLNHLASYREVATDPDTGEVTTARTDVLTTGASVGVGGVQATVVRDTEYEGGLLLEDTLDFFAQDTEGNVWYFGEQVVNFEYDEDGTFLGSNTEGSFRADEPGNAPGWVVQATPVLGPAYFIEFVPGVAEDERLVAGLGETLRTGLGRFRDVVRVIESSALEPEEGIEVQFYAPGFGLIAERSLLPDGTVESEAELDRVADVTRRDTDDGDDTTVALSSLREGRAVRAPAEVADLDPADFAGGGVRHVTIVRADAGSANALGAYVADAAPARSAACASWCRTCRRRRPGTPSRCDVPEGKVLGLFLVADADRLGLDLGDYAGGGLRLINPLTGARASLGDVLAPHVADAAGRILPMQPLSALGADDGTNYLNPAAGLHASASPPPRSGRTPSWSGSRTARRPRRTATATSTTQSWRSVGRRSARRRCGCSARRRPAFGLAQRRRTA